MSLVVEDGSGLATAESYISVADADTRHSNLGNTAWTDVSVTTQAKEAALRKATNYMVQAYRERWQGLRLGPVQSLDWPRMDVFVDLWPVASNIVPATIANACADLALKALSADLAPDLTQNVVSETVGQITVEYDKGSPQYKRYRAIDLMLEPYFDTGSSNAPLVRA